MAASLLGQGNSNVTLPSGNFSILYDQLGTLTGVPDGGSCAGYTVSNDSATGSGDLMLGAVDMNGQILLSGGNATLSNTHPVPYHPGERARLFRVTGQGIKIVFATSSTGNITISGGIFAQK